MEYAMVFARNWHKKFCRECKVRDLPCDNPFGVFKKIKEKQRIYLLPILGGQFGEI